VVINAQHQLHQVYDNLPQELIYSIKTTRSGRIYFLTNYNDVNQRGLYSYVPATGELIDLKQQLGLKVVPAAIETDQEENLWLTTNGNGVYCITPSLFTNYNPSSGLSNAFVKAIEEDKQGNIYVGTINGLDYYQNGQFVRQSLLGKAVSYEVTKMLTDQDKNIIVASAVKSTKARGYYLHNISTQKATQLYKASFYNPIYLDKQHKLWSFTEKSLFYYPYPAVPTQPIYYPLPPTQRLSQIFEYEGKYWFASNRGLFAFETYIDAQSQPQIRILDSISTNNGLASKHVNVVKLGNNGELWIGTKKGICRLKNGQIACFNNTQDGLIADNCTQIEIDQQNRVWIGTPQGIACFDGEKFANYNHKTGLIAADINCLRIDSKQNLWIGTSKGISVLNLQSSLKVVHPPQVYINQLKLNGNASNVRSVLQLTSPSNLKIHLQTLSYQYPEGIRYQYRINQGAWQNVTQHVIDYNAFEQGKYIFEIRAKKFDSGWSSPKVISLIVSPPLWRTWWAIGVYLLLAANIMWAIIRWRSAKLQKEKLKLEQVVIERTYELAQQKEEIASQAEKLKVLNQVQSNFFAGISHELRTPLTLIVEPAEKLLEYTPQAPAQRYTQTIIGNAQRLLRLINQLMDFSKLENGKMTLQLSQHNLYRLLEQVTASFELLAQQKNVTIALLKPNQEFVYEFDRDKFEKIFFNLISNALKFTPAQGSIKVKLWQDEALHISVTDTGIGMATKDLPFIFDRFYQVDGSTTKNYPGTGIGLALAKELVELHDGNIEVQSEVHQGSKFLVSFPLQPVENNLASASPVESSTVYPNPVISHPLETPNPPSKTAHKVLVTEDNPELRQFICHELASTYQVIEAANGAEGIEQALEHVPDLIITDIMMPQTDGFTLVKTLRQTPATSHIPIIILSAKTSPNSKLKGLEIGSDDYLTKPFSSKELLLKVRNMLQRKEKLWQVFQQSLSKPHLPIEPSAVTATSMDEQLLEQALKVVENHLSDTTFDVKVFCQEMGMSRSSLHQKLKALTNMSTTEFIRSIRLKRAAALIQQKSGRIEEIAFQVGFNDISYFNRCFKKQFNLTPKQHQKEDINN
jgi:signal transduction histidine kinase/DNA-binding response OmpR family regulator/ligand-binding sensor domain-containing protein